MSVLKLRIVNSQWLRLYRTDQVIFHKGVSPYYIRQRRDLIINRLLQTNQMINDEKWLKIRKDLFDSDLPITNVNVDSVIVDTCWGASKPELALSYIKFLKAQNEKLNIATTGKYFKLLHDLKKTPDAQETEDIFKLYDIIRAEYPILDALTAENCILALSLTNRWKEGMELLEMIELTNHSRAVAYSAVAAAAFDHDNAVVAWEYMKKMVPRLLPSIRVYNSYINFCIKHSKTPKELEYTVTKIFEFWAESDLYPQLNIVNRFMDVLNDSGAWTASKATIKPDGICSHCKHELSELQLNQKDFDYLSKTILSDVLVGNDIYNKTTPEELKLFKKFVESTKPYDVVIDGLNAAYTLQSHGKEGKHNHARELASVVRAFAEQNKKIFVLGRRHMNRWSISEMKYVRTHSHLFLANDLSQDDPYLLYAALMSGMNTYFSSRDFMREHKFILSDPRTKMVFKYWQMTRQICPMYVGTTNHRHLLLHYPPSYVPIAQKHSNGWHIPYSDDAAGKEIQPLRRPKTWICLRRIEK